MKLSDYGKAVQAFIGAAVPALGIVTAQLVLTGSAKNDVTIIATGLTAVGAALGPVFGPANTVDPSKLLDQLTADFTAAKATIAAYDAFISQLQPVSAPTPVAVGSGAPPAATSGGAA